MFLHRMRAGASRRAGRFAAETAGGLTVFSLFVILMMLMAGGLAVDFMRQETTRVRLSSTLDRAILAAADMDQDLDPEAVVRDYFAKAGLSGYTLDIEVTEGLTAREVSARVNAKLDPYFLNLVGITEIDAPAAGTAEESLSNIEVSLVLDISGSMSRNSKIDNLKVAAKEFVDLMFAQTVSGRTTISLVPYSTQVNAGADLLQHFNVTNEHASSHCVDFAEADYDQAGIGPDDPLQRTGHFDPTSSQYQRAPVTFVCRTSGGMEVLPVSGDATVLKAQIDTLVATGWTSIDVGVKWGSALLDPAARPVIDEMIDDGDVAVLADGRPYDYDPSETLKVIVVMTDGINTTQWYLDDRYKDGLSDVWMDPDTDALSVQVAGTYYIAATGQFDTEPVGGADAVQLSYPELWANVSVQYNARLMADATGDASAWDLWTEGTVDFLNAVVTPGVYSWIAGADKDARLDKVCDAAKAAGIRIYSIGFEVTDDSAVVMQNCATTPSHFFRVEGTEIAEAFRAIANDIGKLRLTQ